MECHFIFKFETSCTTILEKLKTYPKYILKRRSSRETRYLVRARETRGYEGAGENSTLCKSDFLSLNFVRNGLPPLSFSFSLSLFLSPRISLSNTLDRAVSPRSHRTLFSFLSHLVRCTSRRKKVHKGSRSASSLWTLNEKERRERDCEATKERGGSEKEESLYPAFIDRRREGAEV